MSDTNAQGKPNQPGIEYDPSAGGSPVQTVGGPKLDVKIIDGKSGETTNKPLPHMTAATKFRAGDSLDT